MCAQCGFLTLPEGVADARARLLDHAFAVRGYSLVPLGRRVAAAAVAIEPNGRVVTAGEASLRGKNVIVSTRMTPSGHLDKSYGHAGVAIINPGTGAGMDSGAGLALETNGDIVIAGTARSADGRGPLSFAAVRLQPNGRLDRSFGKGGIATIPMGRMAIANAVAIQPNGRIVLAGGAFIGHDIAAVVRLNPDGSPDRTFGDGGVSVIPGASVAWGLVRSNDGGLLVSGQAHMLGAGVYMAARLCADGAPDRAFGDGGVVEIPIGPFGPIGSTATALAMALERGGNVVLAGDATVFGVKLISTLRLRSNGEFDRTFGIDGVASVMAGFGANAMAVDPSGRILVVGGSDSVLRLTRNGRVDTTFGNGGIVADPLGKSDSANGIALEPRGGRFVLAGGSLTDGHLVLSVVKMQG
jgi:uncharacterized delta-60 repeat protein